MRLLRLVFVLIGGKHRPSQPNFVFYGFSDLPRAPAPLCGHGLLRQRVEVITNEPGRGWKDTVMMKVECLEHTDVMFVTIIINDFCRTPPSVS